MTPHPSLDDRLPVAFRPSLAAGVLLALGCACGGAPHASASAPPPAVGTVAASSWKKLSWEDRHDVMTFAVLPNMARAFQRFRGASAPDMTCRTCHGADAEKVAYEMPHGLPALDPRHMPSVDSPDPKEARIAKFMFDEVTPQMADLLGVPLYDPETHARFGCFSCHPSTGGAP